jgi:hypothetical protein
MGTITGSIGYLGGIDFLPSSTVGYVTNCMAYDFTASTAGYGFFSETTGSNKAYYFNCTAIDCQYGFSCSNANLLIAKNCGASGCGTGFEANVSQTTCSSSTPTFVNAGSDDFHLASNDTTWLGYGTNLYNDATYPFQDDIDGQDRGGAAAAWDIGADEYVPLGSSEGTVWGYQTPTGFTGESWSTWKTAAGGAAVVDGDADWGKLNLTSTNHYGPVKDTGNSRGKRFVIKRDSIGTGLGTVNLFIRGSTTSFAAADGSPSWEAYSAPVNRVWRYVQAKAEKV